MEFLLLIQVSKEYEKQSDAIKVWIERSLRPDFEILKIDPIYSQHLGYDFLARVKEVARTRKMPEGLVSRVDIAEQISDYLYGTAFFEALEVVCIINDLDKASSPPSIPEET